MQIITEVPQVTQTTEDYTLAELRKLKADWLEAARADGKIQACFEIAQGLGKPFTPRGRDTWQAWEWSVSRPAGQAVVVIAYRGYGAWLPGPKKYDQIDVITIQAGPWQLAYVRDSDSQEAADNFFVPGPWIDEVLPHAHEAHLALAERTPLNTEKERQALARQLLIGMQL